MIKTKAYAIKTEKSKADEMQRVLKEACKKTNNFVPFHLRAKHPEAFSRFIQQHTKILSQNHTIIVNFIGNQSILYLEEKIRAVPGVIDLVPCQSVETDGKFRAQVRKEDFYKVRSELAKCVPKWYEELVPARGCKTGDAQVSMPSGGGPISVRWILQWERWLHDSKFCNCYVICIGSVEFNYGI